jgi:hypothetical protein
MAALEGDHEGNLRPVTSPRPGPVDETFPYDPPDSRVLGVFSTFT